MSESIARALSRLPTQYPNGGHLLLWPQDLNDAAIIAKYVGQMASDALGYYNLTSGVYTLALSISGGQLGTGLEPMKVPLNMLLGSAAFMSAPQLRGFTPTLQISTYTILPSDIQRMVFATSGTPAWTLLDAADYPDEFAVPIRNRSGATITITRTNSGNSINGSVANYSFTSGNTTQWIFKTSSTSFEIG